jgi:hypothetical protein
MPKTSKTQAKPKAKPNSKLKSKKQVEPQRVSITSNKWYWVSVSAFLAVFGGAYGYSTGLSAPAIILMIVAVLSVAGFAAYIRLTHSNVSLRTRAASLIFGFSILGFGIWALIVLLLSRLGLQLQIANSIGEAFFAITTLITCLMVGAFLGDSIGKHFEALKAFFKALPGKIFGYKD